MNFLATLFEDLRSTDPALRYAVLSRMEAVELSPQDIAAFRSLTESEKDPGSRFHMKLILHLLEQKRSATPPQKHKLADIESILQNPVIDFFHLTFRFLVPGVK
ncbi:MAG: hypothetical protein WA705_14250 [Candidatus Ozemobacteraceae bacterium]